MFFVFKRVRVRKRNTSWKKHSILAKQKVISIIEDISNQNNIVFEYKRISIRNQKTRWGSCSSAKNLNFNYKIVFLPKELANYLVIHELCHLTHFNHSKDFWNLVETMCPNFQILEKTLKTFKVATTSEPLPL